jgi:hypothetical protein
MVAPSPSPKHHGRPVIRVLLDARPGVGKRPLPGECSTWYAETVSPSPGLPPWSCARPDSGLASPWRRWTVPGRCWPTSICTARPGVGKYGVDVVAFERLAVPALAVPARVVVIDELGKVELASAAFRETVRDLFARPVEVVATVHPGDSTDKIAKGCRPAQTAHDLDGCSPRLRCPRRPG